MALSVDKIINVLDSISPDLNVQEHTQVIEALRRTLNRLQTPFERTWEMIIPQPLVFAACQTTTDLGLWEAWRSAGGGQKSLDELVELCNKDCNPNLLRRLMRLLVARNVVEETGLDMFQPTAFSLAMGERSIALTLQSGTHHWIPTALEVPSHLAQTAYQESTDANNTAYIKIASNPEKLDFFARCGQKPEYQESFVQSMSTATAWKQDWTDYFDTSTIVDETVLDNGKKTPIFVEIGGNTGVDVTRFLEKHPDVPDGSLVLQDLDDVISMVKVDPKIRVMAHDFFKPQPVINSRIYFLHAILHDWPDALALQILSNLVPAFKKGYSKLLIADVVIPPEGASAMQAAQDLLMLGLLSAGERTEAAWSKLLNTAGFKVVKMWKDSRKMECVIEAELE